MRVQIRSFGLSLLLPPNPTSKQKAISAGWGYSAASGLGSAEIEHSIQSQDWPNPERLAGRVGWNTRDKQHREVEAKNGWPARRRSAMLLHLT
jgi:hypothetical protein